MKIKTEDWCGHKIRFVEKAPDEWWAMLEDVGNEFGLTPQKASRWLQPSDVAMITIGAIEIPAVREIGLYKIIFMSADDKADALLEQAYKNKDDHEVFCQQLRGLNEDHYDALRLKVTNKYLDKIRNETPHKEKQKAKCIANRIISKLCGHRATMNEKFMTLDMLAFREQLIEQLLLAMMISDDFELGKSITQIENELYNDHKQRVKGIVYVDCALPRS